MIDAIEIDYIPIDKENRVEQHRPNTFLHFDRGILIS